MNTSAAYDRYSDMLLEKSQMPTEQELISEKTNEFLAEFSNERDSVITDSLCEKLGGDFDYEIYSKFVKEICLSQAKYKLKEGK